MHQTTRQDLRTVIDAEAPNPGVRSEPLSQPMPESGVGSGKAGMYLVRDAMTRQPFYVTPEATVRTAVELLRLNPVDVVPVVEDDRILGLLEPLTLCMYDGEVCVQEVLHGPVVTVESHTPLARAAMLMRTHKLRQIPVLREGAFVGMLSERDLLNVWSVSVDSLTGLPVQHQLRRWMSAHLANKREVVILFLDLDNFGKLNKEQGHVYGDSVLKRMAEILRDRTDPERDFACRYGGDEFAIGTLRAPDGAAELAREIAARVRELSIDGRPPEISVSIGIAGGRRMHPRPGTHADATLDDLITRASMASTSAKLDPERVRYSTGSIVGVTAHSLDPLLAGEAAHAPGASSAADRVIFEGYRIGDGADGAEVTVRLRFGTAVFEGQCGITEGDVSGALARATAQSLQKLTDTRVEIRVDDIFQYVTPRGIACVGAAVTFTHGEQPERMVGTVPLVGDVYRTYAKAVLDATNRRLMGVVSTASV